MREEDAQNKICPINSIGMYIAMSASSTQRRVDALVDNCKCAASDCMMWRWDEAFDMGNDGDTLGGTNYDTEGHCGLAGKE